MTENADYQTLVDRAAIAVTAANEALQDELVRMIHEAGLGEVEFWLEEDEGDFFYVALVDGEPPEPELADQLDDVACLLHPAYDLAGATSLTLGPAARR